MRSDTVKKGIQQAPHRSLFNALGLTEEELQKPLIGVVSSYNEIVPGHMNLDKIVEAVKLGVAMLSRWVLQWQEVHQSYFRRSLFVTESPWDILV